MNKSPHVIDDFLRLYNIVPISYFIFCPLLWWEDPFTFSLAQLSQYVLLHVQAIFQCQHQPTFANSGRVWCSHIFASSWGGILANTAIDNLRTFFQQSLLGATPISGGYLAIWLS
jgi:hypothetical protein